MKLNLTMVGAQIKRFMIILIRTCYRSVSDHPCLVCLFGFLSLLYTSFPLAFSILVSASPVLVCTAVLLGTLLSFGQPNIPEIEEDIPPHVSSLRAEYSEDGAIVLQRDERVAIEKYTESRRDLVEMVNEEVNFVDRRISRNYERLDEDKMPLIDSNLMVKDENIGSEIEQNRESAEELRNELGSTDVDAAGILKVEDEKGKSNCVHSSLDPSWKLLEEHIDNSDEDCDEDVNESPDSRSDREECSSPDAASVDDIIPMLDELHPLLDSEDLQHALVSRENSDSASESEQSCRSSDNSVESDQDTENQEDVEDNDEGGEEIQERKGDEIKSAITWTEDDQKNLIDLGTSDLERNQRLENLIARRRARKNIGLTAEKNLIDFEGSDLPFNIPAITTRCNPFDLPYDCDENTGLPPIPGSAPSILLPRRNPFDLPYDPNEEKPNLTGDNFQEEFISVAPKDAFFRRHESFSLGPSGLGILRQERQDFKWKPYVIPERSDLERTSYAPLQQKPSEVGDSKLGSSPVIEPIYSTDDHQELSEHAYSQEAEIIPTVHANHDDPSTADLDSKIDITENTSLPCDKAKPLLGNVGNYLQTESSFPDSKGVPTNMELERNEFNQNGAKKEQDIDKSNISSFSEADVKISDEKSVCLGPENNLNREPLVSVRSHPSMDTQDKEPVYDSSPPAVSSSLSPISSDQPAELPQTSLPLVSGSDSSSDNSNLPFPYERLLSELERVGDFSVRKEGSNLNEVEKHLDADQSKLKVPFDEDYVKKPKTQVTVLNSLSRDPNPRGYEDLEPLEKGVNAMEVVLPRPAGDKEAVIPSKELTETKSLEMDKGSLKKTSAIPSESYCSSDGSVTNANKVDSYEDATNLSCTNLSSKEVKATSNEDAKGDDITPASESTEDKLPKPFVSTDKPAKLVSSDSLSCGDGSVAKENRMVSS